MAKMKRCSIILDENIAKKLEVMAKVDKKALDKFIEDKLSFEELAQIIGSEKARAARVTKRIGVRGKELLKSL